MKIYWIQCKTTDILIAETDALEFGETRLVHEKDTGNIYTVGTYLNKGVDNGN